MKRVFLIAGTSLLLLNACSSTDSVQGETLANGHVVAPSSNKRDPERDDPYFAPVDPEEQAVSVSRTGSLFNPRVTQSLYAFNPHFSVGDTVIVELEESATAKKSANSNMKKDTTIDLQPITVPGGTLKIGGKEVQLAVDQQNEFKGEADADQMHTLKGKITVSVIDVLANGNLMVRGEKWLNINNGEEFIRLTGIVRPKDIDENNTVSSYKVANARIDYSGTGELADTQSQGWLATFFNGSMWPF